MRTKALLSFPQHPYRSVCGRISKMLPLRSQSWLTSFQPNGNDWFEQRKEKKKEEEKKTL
jgi:hypothetical protein